MRRERFTIVHVHTPKAELLGALAARLAGVPIVVDTFRGVYYRSDMHPFWRWLFLRMAQLTALCSDVVLSQSREAMEMAVREGVCPPSKIKPLGNGIDVRRFDRQQVLPDVLVRKRTELGIPQDSPVIGFVGRLVAEKTPFASQIIFTAYVDDEDMSAVYTLADVLAFPSLHEGFGIPLLEAMACGVPIVTSNISAMPEVAGDAAVLVDPYSVDAISSVLNDESLRKKLVARGFERLKFFNAEDSASAFLEAFDKLNL